MTLVGWGWALFAGCQPWAEPDPPPPECARLRPELGVANVGLLQCDALVPALGEGRAQVDTYVETNAYRAVIRHPLDALTAKGLGGGTIVDASPWGHNDTVHEVIPVVGGGWLTDVSLAMYSDRVEVSGTVTALPDLGPAVGAGQQRTVTYRIDPDNPKLWVDGAEALYIHPLGDTTLYQGVAQASDRAVGAYGAVTDLGGAFVVASNALLVATDDLVWAQIEPETQRIAGTAPHATRIALFRGGVPAGTVPIVPPAFTLRAPLGVDGVRAEADSYAPSPVVPPSDTLDLALGGQGWLDVRPVWPDGVSRWSRVRWTAADRAGSVVLDPPGAKLGLGAGTFDVIVSAGPAFVDLSLHLDLHPGETVELPVRLPYRTGPDGPGRWVLAGFGRPADRSRYWRGSDVTATRAAAADGLAYATFTIPDDVPALAGGVPGLPRLALRGGVELRGDGYTIAGAPFKPSARVQLHGAPRTRSTSPLDDAAVLYGGPDDARTLYVDLPWLSRVGAPYTVDLPPSFVALDHPTSAGPAFAGWAPWLAWLDASRPVVPTGPYTWVRVDDPGLLGTADVEQGLARGVVCAGNGPLIGLTVDGTDPGYDVPPPDTGDTGDTGATGATTGDTGRATGHTGTAPTTGDTGAAAPIVHALAIAVGPLDGVDHLALLGPGGALVELPVASAQVVSTVLDGRWVAAAVWSDDPAGPWAVTGPVWLSGP